MVYGHCLGVNTDRVVPCIPLVLISIRLSRPRPSTSPRPLVPYILISRLGSTLLHSSRLSLDPRSSPYPPLAPSNLKFTCFTSISRLSLHHYPNDVYRYFFPGSSRLHGSIERVSHFPRSFIHLVVILPPSQASSPLPSVPSFLTTPVPFHHPAVSSS